MDEKSANSRAWDWEAENGNAWARIVGEEEIEKAKAGEPGLRVTVERNVPHSWVERLKDKDVLILGGGGGQQTPILSAYGCRVTTLDISERMIDRDKAALERYGLDGECLIGDMSDLSVFGDGSFSAIVNPVSLNFVEDIQKVFKEEHRVLRDGGILIFGIANPALYLFDDRLLAKGRMKVRFTLPFSDTKSLSRKDLERRLRKNDTVEFSHTLDTIIGGLTETGFSIQGFFSDTSSFEPIDSFLHDCYLAFLAVKVSDLKVL